MRKLIFLLGAMFTLIGCSEQSEEDENSATSVQFRNIDVTVEANVATVIGEVSTTSQEFFYVVLLGEEQVTNETKMSVEEQSSESWSNFTIELSLTEDIMRSDEVPVFQLYGKTEDGDDINPNYVPIDVK